MGLHLILAALDSSWIVFSMNVLTVLVGLGMVIFVHEFGHFAVAKMCGVKCEKFYLGFDIFGLKFCKFTWGETEYGVGILPLGGYVKMLGQEDNPARLRQEVERARARKAAHEASQSDPGESAPGESAPAEPASQANQGDRRDEGEPDTDGDHPAEMSETDLEVAERALFDPRSYLAQSVPKRMAIISAGVIMNVLFAFVAGVIAYGIGVNQTECAVGAILPGEGAWRADLKVDDRIEKAADKPLYRFADLQQAISLGDDVEQGVPLLVRRPGVAKPFEVTVIARQTGLAPAIGIGGPLGTSLSEEAPVFPGTSAAAVRSKLQSGDKFVRIGSRPITTYGQIHAELARHPDQVLKFTVERAVKAKQAQSEGPVTTERFGVEVQPEPMRRLGLEMEIGPITAIQANSPADGSEIRPGDLIRGVDGLPPGDPMTLPDRLRRRVDRNPQVVLTVSRKGETQPIRVPLRLRPVDSYDAAVSRGGAISIPALGIAYQVLNRVHQVRKGSPADKAGLRSGDVIAQAKLLLPDQDSLKKLDLEQDVKYFQPKELTVELDRQKVNWPYLFYSLQRTLPGTRVELETEAGQTHKLDPVAATDWFNPDRGFLFEGKDVFCRAGSVGEALRLGTEETFTSLTMVFRFIRKVGSQVSIRAVGGPWTIAKVAYHYAAEGPGQFMLFLTLISANLAVINFLPIPVLDGGHMIFLAYEGIRGKPPSENVHVTLSYLGLILILALMIFAFGLDFGCIARQ